MISRKFLLLAPFIAVACGQGSDNNSAVKVTSGFEVEEDAYPSIAYFSFESAGIGYVCTGTFITDRYLLTAGHCTGDGQATILRGEAAGKVSRRVHIHPNYDVNNWHETNRFDLAVYEFASGTAPETTRIRSTPIEADEAGLMLGYGISNLLEDSGAGVLRMGINRVDRKDSGKVYMNGTAAGPQLEFANNQSILGGGDSGGPLLYFRSGWSQDIVGVASGGSNAYSFWVDLHSPESKRFLKSLNYNY